ncbi:hypothetical protein C8Q79DRAFT_1010253 [Trametes meyenii]|nr:hypothetical protein C8Q79DRAFT_1010253 [Trametes meyenii]
MPRGLSVHAFKTAFGPSQPPAQPPAPKYDPRPPPSNGGAPWNRQLSYQASRSETDRKQPPLALSQDRRVIPVSQPGAQPWPVDTKYAKSQKGFSIHPSLAGDGVFVYERSILSVDDLSSSPSSDTSSDSELYPEVELALSRLEISSTRASSSTETLESTLYPDLQSRGPITGSAAAPGLARPPLAITAPPPRPPSTRPPTDSNPAVRPAPAPVPISRSDSHRPRTASVSHAVHPIQFSTADTASDSDSDTLFSEGNPDTMVVDMLGASQAWSAPMGTPQYARGPMPSRRDSDQRVPSSRLRRDSLDTSAAARSRAPTVPVQYREEGPGRAEDAAHPRAPPGLYGVVATPPDVPHYGSPPRAAAPPAISSSPPGPSAANAVPGTAPASRSPPQQQQMSGSPQQLTRTASVRPTSFPAPEAPMRPGEASVGGPSTPTASSPSRKNSQAGAPQGSPPQAGNGPVVPSAKRSVRWNENLVCPSPVPPENRRKGWFNRRGDQLWTNDGQYRLPEQGQEYPPDLALYPEPNTGWMNEEGTRIDMQHRLVPKPPLRSALKQPKSAQSV